MLRQHGTYGQQPPPGNQQPVFNNQRCDRAAAAAAPSHAGRRQACGDGVRMPYYTVLHKIVIKMDAADNNWTAIDIADVIVHTIAAFATNLAITYLLDEGESRVKENINFTMNVPVLSKHLNGFKSSRPILIH
jgi:hypothetical protein